MKRRILSVLATLVFLFSGVSVSGPAYAQTYGAGVTINDGGVGSLVAKLTHVGRDHD
jgi:hypothetical protein